MGQKCVENELNFYVCHLINQFIIGGGDAKQLKRRNALVYKWSGLMQNTSDGIEINGKKDEEEKKNNHFSQFNFISLEFTRRKIPHKENRNANESKPEESEEYENHRCLND